MPAPTPLPLRKAIWHRHHNGQTPATIAHDLGLRLRTVQQLLRRGRGALHRPLVPALATAPETTTANNSARRPSRRTSPASHLGRRLSPHSTASPPPRRQAADGTHLTTLSPPSRPGASSQGPPANGQRPACRPASRGLADGCRRTGSLGERAARLVAADRR